MSAPLCTVRHASVTPVEPDLRRAVTGSASSAGQRPIGGRTLRDLGSGSKTSLHGPFSDAKTAGDLADTQPRFAELAHTPILIWQVDAFGAVELAVTLELLASRRVNCDDLAVRGRRRAAVAVRRLSDERVGTNEVLEPIGIWLDAIPVGGNRRVVGQGFFAVLAGTALVRMDQFSVAPLLVVSVISGGSCRANR